MAPHLQSNLGKVNLGRDICCGRDVKWASTIGCKHWCPQASRMMLDLVCSYAASVAAATHCNPALAIVQVPYT